MKFPSNLFSIPLFSIKVICDSDLRIFASEEKEDSFHITTLFQTETSCYSDKGLNSTIVI